MRVRAVAVGVAIACVLVSCAGQAAAPPIVQYPPGQRPCAEAHAVLDQVLRLQLLYGSGPKDPDGQIVQALEAAKTPLRYHAGQSQYYNHVAYDMAADNLYATIDPLIQAYKQEDPNTPYDDSPDWSARYNAYTEADAALNRECSG